MSIRDRIKAWKPISYFSRGGRWVILLFCLLLSLFLWLFQALNDTYTKRTTIAVEAPTLPFRYNIDGRSSIPSSIEVDITAKGNSLMSFTLHSLFQKKPVLKLAVDTIQLSPEGGYITIGREELLRQLKNTNELLDSHFSNSSNALITLYPDMISLSYAPLKEKKIDVFFAGQLDLGKESNRQLISFEMEPEAVVAYGTATALDSLSNKQGLISTESATLTLGNDSINWHKVALVAPPNVRLLPDSVTIKTKVVPLKYGSITISDIGVRNLPEGYYIRLFPSSIKLTFLAHDDIDVAKIKNEVRPYIDLNEVEEGTKELKVRLAYVPKDLQMIQLEPDKLEYLIEQK